MRWRENNGLRWLEADLGGARAAFTTRIGGVSEAPFDSLNLGLLTDDRPAAVAANRLGLAAALGLPPERIVFGRQVHGAELAFHDRAGADPPFRGSFCTKYVDEEPRKPAAAEEIAEVDGHVVAEPGLAPFVFTADCLPVALRGPGGVAMLHCGWRGLTAGILDRGAAAVGATDAAIGPGIGPCCYEVGDEVIEAFAPVGDDIAADGPKSRAGLDISAHRRLDLPEVARRLLRRAGVERVESADLCTSCEPELFFSHRRDAGRTGRQGGLVWVEPGES